MLNKKIMPIFLSIFIILCNVFLPNTTTKAEADITAPVINSINIDKTEATTGDTITMTADVQDDSAIQYVIAYYKTPITNKEWSVSLSLSNGKYEGKIRITAEDDSGIWKLSFIQVRDVKGNFNCIYSSSSLDFTNCNFEVKEFTNCRGVSLDKKAVSLKVGKITSLIATISPLTATNKKVMWSSSDNSIVTVDSTGKVIAVKSGTANITVTTDDGGYTSSCTVTVVNILKEDINKDGVIDIKDIAFIASKYNYKNTNDGVTVKIPPITKLARLIADALCSPKYIQVTLSI